MFTARSNKNWDMFIFEFLKDTTLAIISPIPKILTTEIQKIAITKCNTILVPWVYRIFPSMDHTTDNQARQMATPPIPDALIGLEVARVPSPGNSHEPESHHETQSQTETQAEETKDLEHRANQGHNTVTFGGKGVCNNFYIGGHKDIHLEQAINNTSTTRSHAKYMIALVVIGLVGVGVLVWEFWCWK